jgi:hypothetical protein
MGPDPRYRVAFVEPVAADDRAVALGDDAVKSGTVVERLHDAGAGLGARQIGREAVPLRDRTKGFVTNPSARCDISRLELPDDDRF